MRPTQPTLTRRDPERTGPPCRRPLTSTWESQSTIAVASATGQRYIHHEAMETSNLLFVRSSRTEPNGSARPYFCAGSARHVQHRSERRMQITWRLHDALPGDVFGAVRAAVADPPMPRQPTSPHSQRIPIAGSGRGLGDDDRLEGRHSAPTEQSRSTGLAVAPRASSEADRPATLSLGGGHSVRVTDPQPVVTEVARTATAEPAGSTRSTAEPSIGAGATNGMRDWNAHDPRAAVRRFQDAFEAVS